MKEYCQHVVKKFYQSYLSRSFDQDDVALLFVATRDYTKRGAIFREIGDFIAHPSGKSRGIVLDAIKDIVPAFDQMLSADRSGNTAKAEEIRRSTVFQGLTATDVRDELSDVFVQADIQDAKILIDSTAFRDFLACVILLLGAFRILVNGQALDIKIKYGCTLKASVSYESSEFRRHFAELPILVLHNVITAATWPSFYQIPLSKCIARRHVSGDLIAVLYENDLIPGYTEAERYPDGEGVLLNPYYHWHK